MDGTLIHGNVGMGEEDLVDALEDNPPNLFLPFQYAPHDDGDGGPAVTDPLTLHLALPLDRLDPVVYSFSLRDICNDFLDNRRLNGGVVDDADDLAKVDALANALRRLALVVATSAREPIGGELHDAHVKAWEAHQAAKG